MNVRAHENATPTVVLCVEDEPALQQDVCDELAEAGYRALRAAHGGEAIAILRTTRPDLILCDIDVPGMDGFALVQAVQAMGSDFAEIPFVFLTALADRQDVAQGKRLGADDYLIKPIDYELLLATVEARLRQVARIRRAQRERTADVSAEALIQRFGLTPAEAKVAIALTEGLQAQDMAQRFDVARTTIAFHMRNIFQKTATTRQAELVAQLLRPTVPPR